MQGIRLSTTFNAKQTKRDDVMNIQRTAALGLGYPAELTLMLIAMTGLALLAFPVCAIVWRMTAAPAWVIFAGPITSLPLAKAGAVTKGHTLINFPMRTCHWLAATLTGPGVASLPPWRLVGYVAADIDSGHTLMRAIVCVGATISRAAIELLATGRIITIQRFRHTDRRFGRITRSALGVAPPTKRASFFDISIRHIKPRFMWLLCFNYTIAVKHMGIGSEDYCACQYLEGIAFQQAQPNFLHLLEAA